MKVPPPYNDATRGPRLQKVLAAAGVASRRDCEQLIEQGRVSVNGVTIHGLPAWVDPVADHIEVNGQPIQRVKPAPTRRRGNRPALPPTTGPRTYIMLHKPRRVVSTADDDLGRRTVLDLIDLKTQNMRLPRLYPVGRLDAESTGLILLTNDGELTERLTHPRYEVPKQYVVSVRGHVSDQDLAKLRKGMRLTTPTRDDVRRAAVDRVRILAHETDRTRGDRTKLAITLTEGQNREIRRLLARLGHKVRRLKRVAIGPLKLSGLQVGTWRFLTPSEVAALRRAAGLTQNRRPR